MEKKLDNKDEEKAEVNNMKDEIIKILEKMLKKIDLDQNIKTIKFDIITTLKLLLQKNENANFIQNNNNNYNNNFSKHHSNSNPNLINLQNIPNKNTVNFNSLIEDKNYLGLNDRNNVSNYNINDNQNTATNYYSPNALLNKSNIESNNNNNLNNRANAAAPNNNLNENPNSGINRSPSISN